MLLKKYFRALVIFIVLIVLLIPSLVLADWVPWSWSRFGDCSYGTCDDGYLKLSDSVSATINIDTIEGCVNPSVNVVVNTITGSIDASVNGIDYFDLVNISGNYYSGGVIEELNGINLRLRLVGGQALIESLNVNCVGDPPGGYFNHAWLLLTLLIADVIITVTMGAADSIKAVIQ